MELLFFQAFSDGVGVDSSASVISHPVVSLHAEDILTCQSRKSTSVKKLNW